MHLLVLLKGRVIQKYENYIGKKRKKIWLISSELHKSILFFPLWGGGGTSKFINWFWKLCFKTCVPQVKIKFQILGWLLSFSNAERMLWFKGQILFRHNGLGEREVHYSTLQSKEIKETDNSLLHIVPLREQLFH